jgi:hypothetical protein
MTQQLPVLPVRLESDGSVSFLLCRKDPRTLGLLLATQVDQNDVKVPTGLIVDKGAYEVGLLRDGAGSPKSLYFMAEGNAFVPEISTKLAPLWVAQANLKFGPLPANAMDVAEMRYAYTESLSPQDLVLVLESLQAVRSLRYSEMPGDIWVPVAQLAASNPQAFALLIDQKIDQALPRKDFASASASLTKASATPVKVIAIVRRAWDKLAKIANPPVRTAANAAAQAAKAARSGAQPKAA